MKKILSLVLALAATATATAQTEVTNYQPGLTENGITYFLPRTGFHITLTATRTAYTPGEYCRYAERYLRLKNVPQTQYEEWQLTGIQVTAFGEADKTKAYSIKLNPKSSAPLVSMADDGRLLAVNTDDIPDLPELSKPSVEREDGTEITPADYKTEEILAAGSPAKMAELTAAEIYDIRENRSLLTKGQADFMPKDGEQLRLMLSELDTQEEALLQLFKGSSLQETHTITLDYIPEKAVEKGLLFRFSKHLGLVDNDDMAGEPYYISITNLHSLPEVVEAPAGKPKKPVEDLRYIVPGKAAVKIFNADREFYSVTCPLAQFGRVEHLGGELFNKKFTTRVYLSPETGSLLKIEADQP